MGRRGGSGKQHAAACRRAAEAAAAAETASMTPTDAAAVAADWMPPPPLQPPCPLPSRKAIEIGGRAGVTDSIQQAAAGSEAKGPTSTAGETAGVTDSINQAAAGSEDKGPTSPAGGGTLGAVVFVLVVAVLTMACLMRFDGQPMPQVWVLSLMICSCVFLFLMCIWRTRLFWVDFVRLSYAPLLAFCSASAIGSATAVFVLFFGMVWAAGNLGYSLAAHNLRKDTEPAIHALPNLSCPTKGTILEFNFILDIGVPFIVLLWALVMMLIVNVLNLTDELFILMTLSYFGWITVLFWVIIVALVPMRGVLLGKWMQWLLPSLLPCMVVIPLICLVSEILSVLCHLLLMMALVAYLWYNLAIYIHFLKTATPSTTTLGNEDTLHCEILGGKTGQMKSGPTVKETPSEVAATLLLSS